MCVASAAGGMDIEEIAENQPDSIVRVPIEPAVGMQDFQAREIAFALGMETAHLAEWVDWANPILEEPWQVDGGFLHMPDRPGLGISWNQEAVDKYRIR